jgi:hypothetical protein
MRSVCFSTVKFENFGLINTEYKTEMNELTDEKKREALSTMPIHL